MHMTLWNASAVVVRWCRWCVCWRCTLQSCDVQCTTCEMRWMMLTFPNIIYHQSLFRPSLDLSFRNLAIIAIQKVSWFMMMQSWDNIACNTKKLLSAGITFLVFRCILFTKRENFEMDCFVSIYYNDSYSIFTVQWLGWYRRHFVPFVFGRQL